MITVWAGFARNARKQLVHQTGAALDRIKDEGLLTTDY